MPDLPEWLSGGSPAQRFAHGLIHGEHALVRAGPQDVVRLPDQVDPAYLAY